MAPSLAGAARLHNLIPAYRGAMRMSGLPFARPTTAAIASLALVTGLVSIAPGVTAASVATRSAAEPAIDQCFNYSAKATKDQAATTPAVDCLTPHTAQTFLTRVLPESFGIPAKASVASRLKATAPCTTKAANPTADQWAAGERWVRCDVVLRGGTTFVKFAVPARTLVETTPRAQFQYCTPGVPGSRTTAAYPCTNPKKNWIMIAESELGKATSRFPGNTSVERLAKKYCEREGKKFSAGIKYYAWWAIWPNSTGWKRGDRTTQCFVPYSQFAKDVQIQTVPVDPQPTEAPTS
jgi:hypothetical protein